MRRHSLAPPRPRYARTPLTRWHLTPAPCRSCKALMHVLLHRCGALKAVRATACLVCTATCTDHAVPARSIRQQRCQSTIDLCSCSTTSSCGSSALPATRRGAVLRQHRRRRPRRAACRCARSAPRSATAPASLPAAARRQQTMRRHGSTPPRMKRTPRRCTATAAACTSLRTACTHSKAVAAAAAAPVAAPPQVGAAAPALPEERQQNSATA